MTKFAMMVTEKSLKILSTGKPGTVAERCEEVLRQVDRKQMVLEMVFFLGENEFESGETVIHEECESFFGKALPMITVIAQKPFRSTLTAEVLYLRGDGTVEFHDDYLLIRSGKDEELITKGIRFPGSA